jgi:hypothetical protein
MRYVIYFTLISVLLGFQFIPAQAPDTIWTKTLGGMNQDMGHSVRQTTDGGYIVAGYTKSFGAGDRDVWLIKTDAWGDTLWTKTFGGSGSDWGESVQQTTDGGYIVAGVADFNGWMDGGNVWLIKTDASGDTLWTKTFGGSYYSVGTSVQQTFDGGFIITGWIYFGAGDFADVWLIKTNASGDTLWSKTFGGSIWDKGYSVQETIDGGYIVAGYTESFGPGGYDVYLIKTDASGDTLWTKTFGGSNEDWGNSVQQTIDGGYIVAGYTWSFGAGYADVWLIKTDASGDTLWTKTLGGMNQDMGHSVQQTTDGGYIVTGATYSFGAGYADVWLIKTDAWGDTLWTRTFGGGDDEWGESVQQTTDGGYVVTGNINSFSAVGSDVWLIKTAPDPSQLENKNLFILPKDYLLKQNYPNPANPSTTIEFDLPKTSEVSLKLFNILGEEVATLVSERLSTGSYSYEWDGSHLASGVYLYRLETEGYVETKKMILMK